jgi:antirestriction protein ArdC
MSINVYDIVTERIIKSLEAGVVPWRVPWVSRAPMNFISKKPYRGVNVFLLSTARYTSPYWLSYRQAAGKGGQVRKGEKSTPVIFWKMGDDRKVPDKKWFILRYYNVFNVAQCDGIEVPTSEEVRPFTPIEAADRILALYDKGPPVEHGGNQAAYIPARDLITMPAMESFHTPEQYYSTRFHEEAHATGSKGRLEREGVMNFDKFGSHRYSFEELVAECTSSFLCGEAGILDTTFDNSAAYIAHWVGKLKSETKWIVQAGAQAAKAADFILGRGQVSEQQGEEDS